MEKFDQPCLLCKNKTWQCYKIFAPYHVWRCRQCSLLILAPRPSDAELLSLYKAEYFTEHLQDQMPQTDQGIAAQITLRRHFVEWLHSSLRRTNGRMLEIGCATGFLLKAFEQVGWKAAGIEFSQDAAHYARQTLHLDVQTGSVSKETLADRIFDVIVMLHTLEHLPDPLAACKILHDHLTADGYLVIQVPNSTGLQARVQGKKWEGWRIPYHFFHFSPRTLKQLLRKSGFRVITCEYSLPEFEIKLLQKIQKSPTGITVSDNRISATGRKSWRKTLLGWHKKLPLGRDITVIAVKE